MIRYKISNILTYKHLINRYLKSDAVRVVLPKEQGLRPVEVGSTAEYPLVRVVLPKEQGLRLLSKYNAKRVY